MTDMLRNAELSVGNGRNLFTMSRGSFSYKQRISKKTALRRTGTAENGNGYTVSFCMPDDESAVFDLVVTEEGGQKTVEDGWEPHYAVIYGDVADELCILAHMLGMKPVRF